MSATSEPWAFRSSDKELKDASSHHLCGSCSDQRAGLRPGRQRRRVLRDRHQCQWHPRPAGRLPPRVSDRRTQRGRRPLGSTSWVGSGPGGAPPLCGRGLGFGLVRMCTERTLNAGIHSFCNWQQEIGRRASKGSPTRSCDATARRGVRRKKVVDQPPPFLATLVQYV